MKAELNEYGGCFSIDLEAETMKEAVLLARLGLNRKAITRTYVEANSLSV